MGERVAVRAEYIVIEERAPRGAFGLRSFGNGDHRQEHRRIRRVRTLPERVPPIVDEHVDWFGRLDLMPPQLRQIERIAGFELDDERPIASPFEAWKARVAGRAADREPDRLAGHRIVDRTDIEIADRVGRKQSESAPAGDNTGDVLERVEMAGDL